MKKFLCLLTACLMVLSLVGCGAEKDKPAEAPTEKQTEAQQTDKSEFDVDLTKLSSTMVYSEVYNMMTNPDNYMGKYVKMKGNFGVYTDEATGKNYYACIIADATACCQQGVEFVLKGEHKYPDDYPELDTEIIVTGTFDTYYEGENMYCQLIDAKLEA